MTETERVFYDLAAGEYSSAQMDNFLRRVGFEPGPGRCYVITPDMPDGKWVRELK
jgi:hypothetical protein